MEQWEQQEISMIQKKHRRRRWYKVLMALAACVVFVSNYYLILQAITESTELSCGIEEHIHDDSCYESIQAAGEMVLTCSENHEHTDGCYTYVPEHTGAKLICNRLAHTHTEECYADKKESGDTGTKRTIDIQHSSENMPMLLASNDGIENMELGVTKELNVTGTTIVKTRFIPTVTHSYTIQSNANLDTYGLLYDANSYQLATNDDSGNGSNYLINYTLEAGKTYYIGTRYYSANSSGIIPIIITFNKEGSHSFDDNGECVCGMNISDAKGTTNDGLSWYIDPKTYVLHITGNGKMTDYTSSKLPPWMQYKSVVTSIEVEDGVTSVGNYAFYQINAAKDLTIADSVKTIGNYSFYNCTALKNASLPDSITTVGSYAFYNCPKMELDHFPASLSVINDYAFYYCQAMQYSTLPSGLTKIGNYAFQSCTSLPSAMIPDSVKQLGTGAFYGCINLQEVHIPNTLQAIPSNLFYNCNQVSKVEIPDSVTLINSSAFGYMTSLKEVKLSENLQTINSYAFQYCYALKEITFPERLNTVSSYAFFSNSGLKQMTLRSNEIKTIGTNVFQSVQLDKLIIGKEVNKISTSFLSASVFNPKMKIVFEGPNNFSIEKSLDKTGMTRPLDHLDAGEYYVDENGVLYQIKNKKAYLCYCPDNLTTLNIPDSIIDTNGKTVPVAGVESYACYQASQLNAVTIAAGTPKEIQNYAFSNTSNLKSVNGKTSVSEVEEELNKHNIKASSISFYQSGLIDDGRQLMNQNLTYQHSSGKGPVLRIDSRDFHTTSTGAPEDVTYYTGEAAPLSIIVSNPDNSEGDEEEYTIRVYVSFDDSTGKLSYKNGVFDFSSTKGKKYKVTIADAGYPNTYYFDIHRPDPGDTVAIDFTAMYPNGSSGGGSASLWGVVLTESEAKQLGNHLTKPEKYNRLDWITVPNDFTITKKAVYTAPTLKLVGDGKENGEVFVNNLAFQISMNRTTTVTTEGIGKDYMNKAIYHDVMQLPDDIVWAEGVREQVEQGRIQFGYVSGNCFYVTVNGQNIVLCRVYTYSTGGTGISSLSLETTNPKPTMVYDSATNTITTDWVVKNTNPTTGEMPNQYTSFYYSNNVLAVKDIQNFPADGITFHNDAESIESYNYSEDKNSSSQCEVSLNAGVPNFTVSKTSYDTNGYWGSSYKYRITLKNDGALPFNGIYDVKDELDRHLYIAADNLEKMFTDATIGNLLEVTIKNTTLTEITSRTVTGTDGQRYTTQNQNTGVNTQYNGLSTEDPSEKTYSAVLNLKWENGKLKLTVTDDKHPELNQTIDDVQEAGGVAAALESIGFLVTYNTQYNVVWHLGPATQGNGKVEGSSLWGGQSREFQILSSLKDSFMLLDDDVRNARSETYYTLPYNYAYAYYEKMNANGTDSSLYKSGYTGRSTIYRDFYLDKGAVWNGKEVNQDTNLEENSVIDYTLQANHYVTSSSSGSSSYGSTYEILPLTDHMRGAQVLLVPVNDNQDLRERYPDKNIQETIIEEEHYYILNREGTYENVVIGGLLADRVEVKKVQGGMDTMMFWYLTDVINRNTTHEIDYKAMISTSLSGVTETTFIIDNETWLNDHQTHRLWDDVGKGLVGSNIRFDKSIVTNPKEDGEPLNPSDDILEDYQTFHAGRKVTYRFAFTKLGDADEETNTILTNKNVWDALPYSCLEDTNGQTRFRWSKEDISIAWCAADPEKCKIFNENNFHLQLEDPISDPNKKIQDDRQQYIVWEDDFSIQFYGSTTVYMYLTLQLPNKEDHTWDPFEEDYADRRLENTLFVNEKPDTVYHDLSTETKAYLQKGVYSTGNSSSSNSSYRYMMYNTDQNSRLYYTNDNFNKGIVTYYMTICNTGRSRLYLTEFQDSLPKGFSFAGIHVDNKYLYNNAQNISTGPQNSVTSSTNSFYYTATTIKNADNTVVPSNMKKYGYLETEQTQGVGGRQVVRFKLTPNANYPATLKYDSIFDMYYLEKGESFTILYDCFTNKLENTEDIANNVIAMRFYDYNEGGLQIDPSVKITSGFPTTAPTQNNGECMAMSEAEAESYGFNGGSKDSEWLSSRVTLKRDPVLPGIEKRVDSVTKNGGTIISNPQVAEPQDTINWKVTVSNDGQMTMRDYTITDVMQKPYRFTGPVTYRIPRMTGASSYWTELNQTLFTVTNDYQMGSDGVLTSAKITYNDYSTGSSKSKTIQVPIGGKEIPLVIPIPSLSKPISFTLRMYYNEKDNLVMAIRFTDEQWALQPGSIGELKVSTINESSQYANTVFYNTSFITPEQKFDSELVSRGNATTLDDRDSVRSSSQITVTYGLATQSYKQVYQTADSRNRASSSDTINYISLPRNEEEFRYTLMVDNTNDYPMERFILIDNLPEVDDHASFVLDDPRYSEFTITLDDDPKFNVQILLENGNVIQLAPNQYTIQYSDKTQFTADDWDGRGEDWSSEKSKDTRSFRLMIGRLPNGQINSAYKEIPAKGDIKIDFGAKIYGFAPQGVIAWNSFGYHFSMHFQELESAPLKVGVMTPSAPRIRKELLHAYGIAAVTDEDKTFRYLVYNGDALNLEGKSEAEIAETLKNTPYTIADIVVPKGSSSSKYIRLEYMNQYTWENDQWVKTDKDFLWNDQQQYTVMELPREDDEYHFYSLKGQNKNSYTFTYRRQINESIVSVNERDDWKLHVSKVSEYGNSLKNAWIGLYSTDESQAMIDEDIIALGLEKDFPTELVEDSVTYYLIDAKQSDEYGIIEWDGLRDRGYLVRELKAPAGYNTNHNTFVIHYEDSIKDGYVYYQTIVDESGYVLPKTGGMGALPYQLSGILIITVTAILFYKRRRKHHN